MSVGESGRVVIEIDPELKRSLYNALQTRGLTMKGWFSSHAETFISNHMQLSLGLAENDQLDSDAP